MKRILAVFLVLCMLVPMAVQAEVYATLNQKMATRTGPGTKYTEPGTFLRSGDLVTVRSKAWDSANEVWWVQVEFEVYGEKMRAYTGAKRVNVNLNAVPTEQVLQYCTVIYDADAFAGPFYDGFMGWQDTIYRGTSAVLYEVDGGFGLIECWNDREGKWWRAWVDLDTLDCGDYYGGGSYSESEEFPYVYESIYGNAGQNNSSRYPVGEWCVITANSAWVRAGAGTQYTDVTSVHANEWYQILDCAYGSTGKDWYKICVNGQYGWISSGLVTIR